MLSDLWQVVQPLLWSLFALLSLAGYTFEALAKAPTIAQDIRRAVAEAQVEPLALAWSAELLAEASEGLEIQWPESTGSAWAEGE